MTTNGILHDFPPANLGWIVSLPRWNNLGVEFDVGGANDGDIVRHGRVFRMFVMNPMQARWDVVHLTLVHLRQ